MPMSRRKAFARLHQIWSEHDDRLGTPAPNPKFSPTKNESARNYLKREIYRLGRTLLKYPPKNWSTAELVKKLRGDKNRRTDKLGHVFHDLLMAVYDEDFPLLDRQERWSITQELEYAHRHNVTPKYLCGFLYQSGPRSEIRRKLKAGYIEPAFRDNEA
ncbi:MAG: hypothetical protein AAF687_00420 [Pseudomonadota bacterium]